MMLHKMLRLKFSLGFKNCFGVDQVGLGGGLLMLWHDEWEVSLQSYSVSYIDVLIKVHKGDSLLSFFFTGFYGSLVSSHPKES